MAALRNLLFLTLLSLSHQSSDQFAEHVLMARNTLSYRYLALDGTTVSSSSTDSSQCKLKQNSQTVYFSSDPFIPI